MHVRDILGHIFRPMQRPFCSASKIQSSPYLKKLAATWQASSFPALIWDDTLKRDAAKRRHLIEHLAKLGLASFRRRAKAHCGMFFVKKKVGDDGVPWIRLILDARQACELHRRPPKVQLGSGRAICHLDMADCSLGQQCGVGGIAEAPVFAGSVDVNDAFYNFSVPELASWFTLEGGYSGDDALRLGIDQIWDDDSGRQTAVRSWKPLPAVCQCLSRGWSWSPRFCQRYLEHAAAAARPIGRPRALPGQVGPAEGGRSFIHWWGVRRQLQNLLYIGGGEPTVHRKFRTAPGRPGDRHARRSERASRA